MKRHSTFAKHSTDQVLLVIKLISWIFLEREQSINELLAWLNEYQVDFNSVEIKPVENGYGLFAKKDLESNDIPLELPSKIMLSLDYSAECDDIKKMYESDWVLSSMSNINLAMIVAYILLSNDKQFSAYINVLPSSHQTPLFFTKDQLLVRNL